MKQRAIAPLMPRTYQMIWRNHSWLDSGAPAAASLTIVALNTNKAPTAIKPQTAAICSLSRRALLSLNRAVSNMLIGISAERRGTRGFGAFELLQKPIDILGDGSAIAPAGAAALDHDDDGVGGFLEGRERDETSSMMDHFILCVAYLRGAGFPANVHSLDRGCFSGPIPILDVCVHCFLENSQVMGAHA